MDEDCVIGKLYAGGFSTHLTWFKMMLKNSLHIEDVIQVGHTGWQQNMNFWDGQLNFGEQLGSIWVQMNYA
jgi:hypothetical protein